MPLLLGLGSVFRRHGGRVSAFSSKNCAARRPVRRDRLPGAMSVAAGKPVTTACLPDVGNHRKRTCGQNGLDIAAIRKEVNVMKKTAPLKSIVLLALPMFFANPVTAFACSDEAYIGEICFSFGNFCPRNYLVANGQALEVSQYGNLFGVIGNLYGGDGVKTFNLPDLRGRSVVGAGQKPNLSDYAVGQKVDALGTTLTKANIPPHPHGATFEPETGTRTATVTAAGALTLDAAVPVNAGAAGSVAPSVSGGQTVYPTNATATSGPSNYLKGLYTATPPSAANTATMPVQGTITGTAPVAAATASIPGLLTGGTVTISESDPNTHHDPSVTGPAPITLQTPAVAVTACIAVMGVFPPKP